MNRKQNFIAIFAIALMALGTSLLFSCNADEEEYDFNGVYTMANGVKTRSGENTNTQIGSDTTFTTYHFVFARDYDYLPNINHKPGDGYEGDIFLKIFHNPDGTPGTEMISYLIIPTDSMFRVNKVYFRPDTWPGRYILCASGECACCNQSFTAEIPNRVFY